MEYFNKLETFLLKLPSMQSPVANGRLNDGNWWVKFGLDIEHDLAWRVVQEIAYVTNYLSLDERLPTVFYPVSPPPYLNGGAEDFLSWVIESKDPAFTPDMLYEWLEGRLPRPVDDLVQWEID